MEQSPNDRLEELWRRDEQEGGTLACFARYDKPLNGPKVNVVHERRKAIHHSSTCTCCFCQPDAWGDW